MNEKQAGGDILGRLAGLVSRPFVGAAKSQAVNDKVVGGITRHVNQPLESGLRRSGIHGAISKAYEYGTIPVPGTPKLLQPVLPMAEQRRAYGQWRADDAVHALSNNPELLAASVVPLPGTSSAIMGGKHLLRKALGVKKLASLAPSFADEIEKIANGDMLQYFLDHPQKLKEKQERDKKKLEKKAEDLEAAYWRMDSLRARGSMSERDAFKSVVRGMTKEAASVVRKKKIIEEETHHCPGCGEELPERGGIRWNRDDNTHTHVKCGTVFDYEKTAQVDPYQQKTQWTCSAACLKAVLQHWGHKVPELEVIKAVGAQKGRGAECDQIAAAARTFGFQAFEYSFQSIEQAKVLLDQDIPIICDIQSFNNPGKGHYVVMTRADAEYVELMDPNAPGNWRAIKVEEMDERWWDRAMAPPHNMMPKWGIIVVPPESSNDSPPQ